MKFLVIRFSSIGDIVLTTPVVRCLKKQVVTAEVHYLTKASFRPILEANPYIDKIHCLGSDPGVGREDDPGGGPGDDAGGGTGDDRGIDPGVDLGATIDRLRAENFDYVIDLHHNLRTWKVKRRLGKSAFSFNKLNIEKWWYTNFKWNRMPAVHIVDRYMETVAGFGVKNDGAGLDYFIPAKDELKPQDIPTSHQAGYVGLVIGAALPTKKLPFHKLAEVCERAGQPLILLGGPEDAATGEKLAAIDPIKIYNACGKFNLNESAGLVRQAKLVVTHDTGLMHIAAAFKRPVVSVWGNTVPEFGVYPFYGGYYLFNYLGMGGKGSFGDLPYALMEVKGLSCRPCSKIGYNKCPKGHFKCMEEQPVERIFQYF
jgi:ADP-heptose:LPS heptosyltransferase